MNKKRLRGRVIVPPVELIRAVYAATSTSSVSGPVLDICGVVALSSGHKVIYLAFEYSDGAVVYESLQTIFILSALRAVKLMSPNVSVDVRYLIIRVVDSATI